MQQTDIAVYAGGILLGVLLGSLSIPVGGEVRLGLGMGGGLLVAGLLLGYRQRWGPLRSHVPPEARQLVRDLGILLFVAETGLGVDHEGLAMSAPGTMLAVALGVLTIAVVGSLLVARVVLRMRPIDAWGSVAGGLTSSAALDAVRRASDSNEAAVSYAAAYATGSVLAAVAGQVVIYLVR